jgi:hypothetical protein
VARVHEKGALKMKLFETLGGFRDIRNFDIQKKRLFWIFCCVPLLAVVVPMSLVRIPETYNAYRALSDRGIEAEAEIKSLTVSGGSKRRSSVLVTYSYRAVDGLAYSAEDTAYSSEAFRWRPGQALKILYDSDNPSTSTLSLEHAREKLLWSAFGSLVFGSLLMLLIWVFWDDYRRIWNRFRTPKV